MISVNEELALKQVVTPLFNSQQNSKIFLLLDRQPLIMGAETLADERYGVPILL